MPVRRAVASAVLCVMSCAPMTIIAAQESPRSAQAQDPRLAMRAVAQEAMKPLLWLVGEWEGPATSHYAPGKSITLTQRETVVTGSFNTAVLVQGRGRMQAGGEERLVYDASALISYDALSKRFILAASGGGGIAGSFDITVDGTSISWGFAMPGERVRYDIALTPDGKWKEIGYVSKDDGKTWTKNLEMLLTRKQ